MEARKLWQIAEEIQKDWGCKLSPYAKPYLDAMFALNTVNDKYGWDSGKSIVLYFLSNAGSWRGETARRVKAELKLLVA